MSHEINHRSAAPVPSLVPIASKAPIYKDLRVAHPASTSILPFLVPCTIRQVGVPPQTWLVRNSSPEEGTTMEGGYEVWMGQPVILRVVAGNLRVPLRGRLLSE